MHPKVYNFLQAAHQHQVQKLLGWTELEYASYQYACGLSYLEHRGLSRYEFSSAFWLWWQNHWDRSDQEFITQAEPLDPVERLLLYGGLHSYLRFRFYPHRAILDAPFQKPNRHAA